jgi:cytochrome c oxidase cbb3-type subunit 3
MRTSLCHFARRSVGGRLFAECFIAAWLFPAALHAGQAHQPTPEQRLEPAEDPAAVGRGRSLFGSTCGFCHGADATGSRAPDLVRSSITLRDDAGDLLSPVIRNGRPEKGMPSFSTLKDDQIANIVAFLHHQATAARRSSHVPGDYPLAKLMTGNAAAGEAYFNGAGGCVHCHSPSGDLAGVAKRFSPVDLQQEMVYPSKKTLKKTAIVTLPDGSKFEGTVQQDDEFTIALVAKDGWYRSWPKTTGVSVAVQDPLAEHRELMSKYTDSDIHNLFAYLETLQ